MKRLILNCIVVSLLTACAQAPANTSAPSTTNTSAPAQKAQAEQPAFHTSDLGFSMQIPNDWMVLDQAEVKQNATLFDPNNPLFANMDKNILFIMKQKLESGTMEMYIHQSLKNIKFADNITAMTNIMRVPDDADGAKQLCDQLPGLYSKELGKTIVMSECTLKTIAGKNALYLINRGAVEGTSSIQYFIQRSKNMTLIMTGTFADDELAQMQTEFADMIQSMKITN